MEESTLRWPTDKEREEMEEVYYTISYSSYYIHRKELPRFDMRHTACKALSTTVR